MPEAESEAPPKTAPKRRGKAKAAPKARASPSREQVVEPQNASDADEAQDQASSAAAHAGDAVDANAQGQGDNSRSVPNSSVLAPALSSVPGLAGLNPAVPPVTAAYPPSNVSSIQSTQGQRLPALQFKQISAHLRTRFAHAAQDVKFVLEDLHHVGERPVTSCRGHKRHGLQLSHPIQGRYQSSAIHHTCLRGPPQVNGQPNCPQTSAS